MTIWNKSLAVVLAAILLLAGCATDTEPTDGESTKTTVTTTSSVTTADDTDPSKTTTTGSSTTTPTSTPSAGKPTGTKPTTGSKPTTRTTTTTRFTYPGTSIDYPRPSTPGTITVACMSTGYFNLDASASSWNARIRKELKAVENEINCPFKTTTYDSAALVEQCIKANLSGTKFADIMVGTVWQQKHLLMANALLDLNDIKYLDLTKPYWDQSARQSMEIYGKNFMGITTLDGVAANANVIYFNKVLAKSALQKLGYEVASPEDAGKILYKMVDDGKWTFDQMQKLSQKASADLTGDGKIDEKTAKDQYGFAGVDVRGSVSYSIFKSKGGYFTKKDSKGNITFALDDDASITALKTLQTWFLKDTSVYNSDKYGNSHTISADAFIDGRVLFLGWTADAAAKFTEMKQDWGILPYPKADQSASYNGAVSWNTQGFSIPRRVKGDDLVRAADALDTIAKRFQTIRNEQNAYLSGTVYRDADSARMMQVIEKSSAIDLVQFADLGSGGLSSIHYLFDKVSNDPTQRVKSVRDEAVKALNDFLTAVK